MIEDYYITLIKRVVTKVSDGAGQFTETLVNTNVKGYIALLSHYEQMSSKQLGVNAMARLFTTASFSITDRVVDGSIIYEVVGVRDKFHTFYELKTYANG